MCVSQNSHETFRSQIYLGAFFGSFSSKKCFSKSPKVFRIVLKYSVNSSSKGHSRAQPAHLHGCDSEQDKISAVMKTKVKSSKANFVT